MDCKPLSRRSFLRSAALTLGAAVAAGCAPQVVEKIVEKTVLVEKERVVKETVLQEKVVKETVQIQVEKKVEVTKIVEKVKEKVLLRWHRRLGGGWQGHKARVAFFEETHPDVKVNIEEFPAGSAEFGPKIAAMIAGGVAGDMTWCAIGTGSFQFLSWSKTLAGLDDMVASDKTGFNLDYYYPRVVKAFRMGPGGQGTGELQAFPELAHGVGVCLFFNKEMIESEGLQAPTDDWTRDQLLEMSLKMTKGDRFAFLPALGDYSFARNHTLPWGGEIISADGMKSQFEDEKVVKALAWVYDLFFKHKVAPTASQIQAGAYQMFLGKKLVSYQSGGWDLTAVKNLVKDAFKWDMVMMPKGPAGHRGGHLHADGEAILAMSKNKALAYELGRTVTDLEGQVNLALEIGLAASPGAYKDKRVTGNPLVIKIGKSTEESAEHLGPANQRKQELQTTVGAILGPLWTGDSKPDAAFFGAASKTLQDFLNKKAE